MSNDKPRFSIPKPVAQFRAGFPFSPFTTIRSFIFIMFSAPQLFGKSDIEDMKLAQNLLQQIKKQKGTLFYYSLSTFIFTSYFNSGKSTK